MTGIQVISNPDIWPTIADDQQRRTELFDWLRANGIEPNDIPIDSEVTVEPGDCGSAVRHTHVIRHAVYLRNEHGHHYLADPDHPEKGAAREERALPLVVPLPDTWPQSVQRAEPEPTGDLDITPYLVVHRYRTDRGDWAWLYRCWGNGGCDGFLSLDWSTRASAERQAREHLAEKHPAAAPIEEG